MKEITVDGTVYVPKKVYDGGSLYALGEQVFIRTVTYHYTGRIVWLSDREVVLADAAWVAESGRFSEALANGVLSETEAYPEAVSINREMIVDISPWRHELPKTK